MENPLQITFHDLDRSLHIEEVIREKFEKVKLTSPDVTKCHVVLEKLSKHHQQSNMACVRLDMKISHFDDIVVREKCQQDAVALKSAVLKVFKHGLELAHKHKERHIDQKRHPHAEVSVLEPVVDVDD